MPVNSALRLKHRFTVGLLMYWPTPFLMRFLHWNGPLLHQKFTCAKISFHIEKVLADIQVSPLLYPAILGSRYLVQNKYRF